MPWLLVAAFILSWFLTWSIRRYALAKNILDIPNHRSSHQFPTPRGGGVAFVLVFLMALPCLAYWNPVHWSSDIIWVGAALCLAMLGFYDDKYNISPSSRIVGHLVASMVALYLIGGMPSLTLGMYTIPSGYLLNTLAVLYLIWLLNLYNFMDGIDGLAGIEALSVCLGATFLYWFSGDSHLMGLPLILAAAISGFLYWNLPPARIFMGDAGSCFLGLVLGVLSIQAANSKPQFFWCWLILLGVFIVDATVTLLRRLWYKNKIWDAHRSHAYQYASRMFQNHRPVTMGILILNVLWLWPLAIFVGLQYINGLLGAVIAYIPLVILAFQFHAGKQIS